MVRGVREMESVQSEPVAAPPESEPVARRGWGSNVREQLLRGLDALAASPLLLLAASVTVNALLIPYNGFHHGDAVLYGLQTLNRLEDGYYADDLYLRYGSQDQYTIFSFVAAGCVRLLGLSLGFFVLYLIFNTAFLWAVQRLVFALVPDGRVAVVGTLGVACVRIGFGSIGIFYVNEPFLTARITANALVLLALERILRGRPVVAFALLALALLLHPLMAFGGLLIAVAWCLAQWLPWRWLCLLGLAVGLGAVGLLLDAPVALRLFGSMDEEWRHEVLAYNFFNFPAEWQAGDWLRILCATAIAVIARAMLPPEARGPRRLLAIIPGVAWLGIVATAVACHLPYALPFQAQPYRAVWILQLLEVPLGVFVTVRWWRMESWGRIFAAAWLGSWLAVFIERSSVVFLLLAASQLGIIVAVFCCAVFVPHQRHRDRQAHDGRLAYGMALLALIFWITIRTAVVIDWLGGGITGAGLNADLGVVLATLYPLIQILVVGCTIYVCSLSLPRAQPGIVAAVGLGAAVALFVGAELGIGKQTTMPYPFIRHYIDAHYQGDRAPTVYWPATQNPAPLWFDLKVACYFDWLQLAGNMFNRGNALEGRRRIRLLRPFETARLREFGGIPRVLERQLEGSLNLPPPSKADLLRVCAEPGVDYVVLKQPFDHLYAATDGQWYLYDCRQLRSGSVAVGE
jgi:hypothetical protein